ncbi:hypothetical protein CVD28_01160 [Bacillus sp. M6-12]|uniref:hypothetical protein n=1 Tax=Bacillus sp. M6-12 TaxID=2054166 RepID=UPI000C77394D|nr:hypothetical protein [Bacillus sp. M6-12]PLS19043.1 hypothetical protein CVD28_01160 [Bacillus sp. M6-12]
MNLYLSKKQEKVLHVLLDTADELIQHADPSVKGNIEEIIQGVTEIKGKLTGKKGLAKNGIAFEPVEINCQSSDDKLIVRAREDGKAIILESKNRIPEKSGHFRFDLGKENAMALTNAIIPYVKAWGLEYTAEDKAYHEEINVFADEVERSISVGGGKISYICYTDNDQDDYWTFLTPSKARYFVELMLGYINTVH